MHAVYKYPIIEQPYDGICEADGRARSVVSQVYMHDRRRVRAKFHNVTSIRAPWLSESLCREEQRDLS